MTSSSNGMENAVIAFDSPSSPPPRCENIFEQVGNTPLIHLRKIEKLKSLNCKLFVKAEFLNPSGTIKDRVALGIFDKIEQSGLNEPGSMLISAPDNELSISITKFGNVKGYRTLAIIPSSINPVVKKYLMALEAKICLVPEFLSAATKKSPVYPVMEIAIEMAKEFSERIKESINIYDLLGCPQIKSQVEKIADEITSSGLLPDLFVAEADSQGILHAIATKIQQSHKECKILGVVSDVFVPEVTLDLKMPCESPGYSQVKITEMEACIMTRMLIRDEGILCGLRGGALLAAAVNYLNDMKSEKPPVVIICITDSYNYCSRLFLSDDWMMEKKYMTLRDVHQKFWWYGISLGNLRLSEPPSVKKNMKLEFVTSLFEDSSSSKLLVIDIDKVDEEGNMTENAEGTVLGIVSRGLLLQKINTGEFSKDKTLEETPDSFCTKFGKISRKGTLGELEKLVKEFQFVVVYSEIYAPDSDNLGEMDVFHVPSGIATGIEIVKWISEVEDHHRQASPDWKSSDCPLMDDYGQEAA